jgi:BirA family transcriptional regulator, biotin operon repressor / biotin---[acetyl-CoA-carboxylase] ligase
MENHYYLDNSPFFELIELDEVDSTNTFLRTYDPIQKRRMTAVTAEYQTAGRGQTGNKWESAIGKNLSVSICIYPKNLKANQQFILSQACALSAKEAIEQFATDITIKWPNDIYWKDKKISGILIENDLQNTLVHRSILGVGININQKSFETDAPNPVSLRQIVGKEIERRFILEKFIERFSVYSQQIDAGYYEEIIQRYRDNLYHKKGFHHYRDSMGDFEARITHVAQDGQITLTLANKETRTYTFKEVHYIIPLAGSATLEHE